MIWKQPINESVINDMGKNTLMETLGIQILEIGDDFWSKAISSNSHFRKQLVQISFPGILSRGQLQAIV
jgi:hypothetical protein